jgi:hypothetical protein
VQGAAQQTEFRRRGEIWSDGVRDHRYGLSGDLELGEFAVECGRVNCHANLIVAPS